MKNNQGQGIVEIIFSIGVITVVITGVVSLMVNVLKLRTNSLRRERAVEMSNVVVESLISKKALDEKGALSDHTFWGVDVVNGVENGTIVSGTLPEFEGYTYSIGFSQVVNSQNCKNDSITCADAIINIFWDENNNYSMTRFFYKNK